ncbi:MAG: hypothetical protein J6I85_09400 [Clostridia bacterium]|nr:hypothetical protein [Clostridia bacterium]
MAVSGENSCAFYASDYHLEMIMLPYINTNLQNDKKIYVFTQNNLENTMRILLDRVNIDKNIKEKVLDINWKIDDENKYNDLILNEKNTKESVVFVKGSNEYIEKVNKNLRQFNGRMKLDIIDCYNIDDVGNNAVDIVKCHKKVLSTNVIK